MELHFGGKFWKAGKSPITLPDGGRAGAIEYGSSDVYVLDAEDYVLFRCRSKGLPKRWEVYDAREELAGSLTRNSPMSVTKFEYDAGARGCYDIEMDPRLRGYRIEGRREAAFVDRKKQWWASDRYRLLTENGAEGPVNEYEWIAVMQGVALLSRRSPGIAGAAFDIFS
ncbi:hypothetical protein [Saccharibacillus sp. O23]|uniref:hypothetical protein n=1 Tax=Saccharibacillus sp. O23 TaxID=2009338 RepID=UPI00117A2490|nr:hypothetical protein [Saccharibacillus sp. O23]